MRTTRIIGTLSALAVGLAVVGVGDDAWSKPKKGKGDGKDEDVGPVTAYSRYGHGSVSAPTRKTRFGREVRLPGGTWIGCRNNCAQALRAETIDFWEEHDKFQGGNARR